MQIITESNQLTIQLQGFEQLWALRRRLQIPHFAILEVDYVAQTPALQDYAGYLRFPGTAVPWRFLAGSYTREGVREFWYVHMRQPGVLTLTLKPGAYVYERIRVTCSPEAAASIDDWWRQHK